MNQRSACAKNNFLNNVQQYLVSWPFGNFVSVVEQQWWWRRRWDLLWTTGEQKADLCVWLSANRWLMVVLTLSKWYPGDIQRSGRRGHTHSFTSLPPLLFPLICIYKPLCPLQSPFSFPLDPSTSLCHFLSTAFDLVLIFFCERMIYSRRTDVLVHWCRIAHIKTENIKQSNVLLWQNIF